MNPLVRFARRAPRLARVLAVLVAIPACAADLPREGRYDYQVCFTRDISRIVYSDAYRAYSYTETGTVKTATPGELFDGERVRCVGTVLVANGKRTNLSICEAVALNGDKRLTRFLYGADGTLQREELAGTGLYEGMVTTGIAREVVPPKEIQPDRTTFCNQLTGTYRLK